MPQFKTVYTDDAHITKIDIGTTDIYIWVALPGTLDGNAFWAIKKVTKGSLIPILHANGTASFDKIWSNRASYSYS